MSSADTLGFSRELADLRDRIAQWLETADPEMQPMLRWQFLDRSKYFRPLTVFACHRAFARRNGTGRNDVVRAAAILEKLHNVTLVIDDILDRSRTRRGKLTMHCRFGSLRALMAAGYIMADCFQESQRDPFLIEIFGELFKRLGVAECLQWRLRRKPLGVEDWRQIAGEDTGSMFEACACLGTHDNRLREFGHLLGLLYHGCDDVSDARGGTALGEGGEADLRDGILTLPAALAIREPEGAALFENLEAASAESFMSLMHSQLPEAEEYLDRIASEARAEAETYAKDPGPLLALVDATRKLSTQ